MKQAECLGNIRKTFMDWAVPTTTIDLCEVIFHQLILARLEQAQIAYYIYIKTIGTKVDSNHPLFEEGMYLFVTRCLSRH